MERAKVGWGRMKQQQRIQQWRQRPEDNMPNPGSHFLLHRRLLWNSRCTSNVTGGRGRGGENSLSLFRTYSPTPFSTMSSPSSWAAWIEVKQGTATSKYVQEQRRRLADSAVAAAATSAKTHQKSFWSSVHARAAFVHLPRGSLCQECEGDRGQLTLNL